MPLLNRIEAAVQLGVSPDLLDYFASKCPKRGEKRLLKFSEQNGMRYFDKAELLSYEKFLRDPWPLPPKGKRPTIPEAIKDDIRAESHYSCAICGYANNGEIAHIEPVASSLNNSPENLLLLCPNHHTAYDYGFRPAANLGIKEIRSAKRLKRRSRQSMLRAEGNLLNVIEGVLKTIKRLEKELKSADAANQVAVYETEMRYLLSHLPDLTTEAEEQALRDKDSIGLHDKLLSKLPSLRKLTLGANTDSVTTRTTAKSITSVSSKVIIDLDEEECPLCHASGQIGLVGDLCPYCGGSCFVETEKADSFNLEDVELAECPHCCGRGQTGLRGDLCIYCGGRQLVDMEEAEEYDPDEVDAVPCPHCEGSGQYGLLGDFCRFCGGAQTVSRSLTEEYDSNEIDEVECPHCEGRGTYGLRGDYCRFCKGQQLIGRELAAKYDPDSLGEVECPHCEGRGMYGLVGDFCRFCHGEQTVCAERAAEYVANDIDEVECPHCEGVGARGNGSYCAYCRGSQLIPSEKAESYNPDDIDEEECPRCHGSGTTGLVGDTCKSCKGDGVVSEAYADAYRQKYGQ